jgi:phosphoribosyl 1,2-cyclic phosphodiesterase
MLIRMNETPSGQITLWGSRGSSPTPGGRFIRHGGHTSCLTLSHDGAQFVFDAGSGIREFGRALMEEPPRQLHVFITHTHWDHIQGFPFFPPAYTPGYEIEIFGARGLHKPLKSVFKGQLDSEYFPVQMDAMRAHLKFHHLQDNPVNIEGVKISWVHANHPGVTLGYKIEVEGKSIAWFPDNEFLRGHLDPLDDLTRESPAVKEYLPMIDFLSGVDLLFHEAQYTDEEYVHKVGWGHSSVGNACLLAHLAGVKRWIITHHDPNHDDAFLEGKLNITRRLLARLGSPVQVTHGYDGLTEFL